MSDDTQKTKQTLPAVRVSLPAKIRRGLPAAVNAVRQLELTKGLPPATIVYGVAAGAFFSFALYLLVHMHWIDGLLTMLPAACFAGFAVHILKYAEPRPQNSRVTDERN